MRVCLDTQPGGAGPNEDWVASAPRLAVVLDGLSTAGLPTGCRHGVPWYVAHLGGHLMAALADPFLSLSDGLTEAIDRVASQHPECDLGSPGTPSATVAILRHATGTLEHLVLADSPIVLDCYGDYEAITDLRVDAVLPDLQAEVARHETHTQSHREAVQRLVAAQREVRNTVEGYWVAASAPEAAQYALTGTTPLTTVRSAAVMSDGVSRLVTEYGMAGWAEVFATLNEEGPHGLIRAVRKVEATDPNGRRWPRYKSGDDATVAFCQW